METIHKISNKELQKKVKSKYPLFFSGDTLDFEVDREYNRMFNKAFQRIFKLN